MVFTPLNMARELPACIRPGEQHWLNGCAGSAVLQLPEHQGGGELLVLHGALQECFPSAAQVLPALG